MQIKDTLYKIESQHDGGRFDILMLDGHPVYEGHFPGQPITPGVLTLAMVRECASILVEKPLSYSTIKNCRFVAMVKPGEHLRLNLELFATDCGYQINANITDHDDGLRLQLEGELV
ncbi:MAG: hypothetical protein J5711_04440 [Bacteroidales bacterium]|nr:hypothetical protein [Bacteroidales bacterium]